MIDKMKGKLIVLEGLDGSGKATQTTLLCEYLKNAGKSFTRLSYPNYDSPSSSLVKMYLGGELSNDPRGVNAYAAAAFYAVDRCADFLKYYKDAYERGELFVSDRYATSNAIYQTSKLPEEQWEDYLRWLEDFEYGKLGVPRPDVVIYLDMNIDVSQKLLSARYHGDESKKDIHEVNVDFLRHCRTTALYAASKLGWHVVKCDDGEKPRKIDDIAMDIRGYIVNEM